MSEPGLPALVMEQEVDLSRVARAVGRRWRIVGAGLVLGAVLGFALGPAPTCRTTLTPAYKATNAHGKKEHEGRNEQSSPASDV